MWKLFLVGTVVITSAFESYFGNGINSPYGGYYQRTQPSMSHNMYYINFLYIYPSVSEEIWIYEYYLIFYRL